VPLLTFLAFPWFLEAATAKIAANAIIILNRLTIRQIQSAAAVLSIGRQEGLVSYSIELKFDGIESPKKGQLGYLRSTR
jgi:hypothetical protein